MVHRIQRSVNWFVTRCVRRFGLNPALNPLDAANTGMRRGEVLGLTCRNVDLDTGRLTVSQQILSVEYEARVAEVKTSHIATLDRAHFTVVRPAHCNAFDLVPKL